MIYPVLTWAMLLLGVHEMLLGMRVHARDELVQQVVLPYCIMLYGFWGIIPLHHATGSFVPTYSNVL